MQIKEAEVNRWISNALTIERAVELVERKAPWLNDLIGDNIIASVGVYSIRLKGGFLLCDCQAWEFRTHAETMADGSRQRMCKHALATVMCSSLLYNKYFEVK